MRSTTLLLACLVSTACAHAAPAPTPEPAPPPASPPPAASPPAASPPASGVLPHDDHGKPVSVLMMPLRPEAGMEPTARAMDELLLTSLSSQKNLQVLGPADINALLGVEKLKDAMGCSDVACAAEIGGALGSRYLIAGQLGALGEESLLSLRLMDTKDSQVLARSSARGGRDAAALSTMAAQAMGDLLGVEIKSARGPVASAPAATDYSGYQKLITQLGRKMANADYTGMLALVDSTKPGSVAVPAGQDLQELLTYYRGAGCYMLKQFPCFEQALKTYSQRWPDGAYLQGLESFANARQTQMAQAGEHQDELAGKIADLEAKRKAGKLSEAQALEAEAYIHMGAQSYREADRLFSVLMPRTQDADKWFQYVNMRTLALQQLGDFATARRLLLEAQAKDPRRFAAAGMNQTLQHLPH